MIHSFEYRAIQLSSIAGLFWRFLVGVRAGLGLLNQSRVYVGIRGLGGEGMD